jgi:hypothetical protein
MAALFPPAQFQLPRPAAPLQERRIRHRHDLPGGDCRTQRGRQVHLPQAPHGRHSALQGRG